MNKIKRVLKWIWNEFVYGGHLLSLGAVSVAFVFLELTKVHIAWESLIIVYLGFQSMYLYNRYREFDQDILTNPERSSYLVKYYKFLPLLICIYLIALSIFLLCSANFKVILFSLILLLLGFSYSFFFKKLTKVLIGFKSFFVSLLWALLIPFLTLLYYSLEINLFIFLFIIFIFLRRFIITSFCDIKDVKDDLRNNMFTLAATLKRQRFIILLNFINLFSIALFLLMIKLGDYSEEGYLICFTFFIPLFYINFVKYDKRNIDVLSEVVVRGEFLLWSLFLLIGKIVY